MKDLWERYAQARVKADRLAGVGVLEAQARRAERGLGRGVVPCVAAMARAPSASYFREIDGEHDEDGTYNSNEMMSRGEAAPLSGVKVSSPFEPPTTTLITLPEGEDGVGSGEPGYDE